MAKTLLLAALLAAVPCAHAQDLEDGPDPQEQARPDAQAEAHRAYAMRLADALAKTGGARELAFAAILRRLATAAPDAGVPGGDAPSTRAPRDAQAEAWLRAAAAKAGDDAIANRLLAAGSGGSASPLRGEAARRWQAADPGNLSPLLHAGLPVDVLLVEARRATHVDGRMYDVVRWMISAYLRHPPTAAEREAFADGEPYDARQAAAMSAMGLWSSVANTGHQALVQSCRGDALRATPTRSVDCRHVAALLAEHSGSAIDRFVGHGMQRELAASAAERAGVDARRRRMDWQMLEWGRAAQRQPDGGEAQFVRLLEDPSIRTEQQLLERVLQEAGVPLEPPADWSPTRR